MSPEIAVYLFMMFIFFLILVGLSRWIFRINHIVNRLDSIMNLLKVGLDVEEITRKKNKKAAAPPVRPAGEKHKCPQCDFVFVGEFGKEGWWCPNCKEAREYE